MNIGHVTFVQVALIHKVAIFECQEREKKDPLCEDYHKNDTTKALELLGQWILNTATTNDKNQKRKFLTKLYPILFILSAC